MRAAFIAQEQRIALRIIPRVGRAFAGLHQAAIGVLAVAGGDAFRDDRALGVLADMDHLGAGVGLLLIVGQGHRIKLADRIIAHAKCNSDTSSDRRAGLDLGPGNF